mgnify:CR=1 FL=1
MVDRLAETLGVLETIDVAGIVTSAIRDFVDEERRILSLTTGTADPRIEVVASGEEIELMHGLVREVPAAENVIEDILRVGPAAASVEIDLMQPLDPDTAPWHGRVL